MTELQQQAIRVLNSEERQRIASAAILLVADDPTTQLLIQGAIDTFKDCSVQVVEDGEEAIYYLTGQNQYADRERYPLPVLILTDLNIVWISGMKLLTWVKQQSTLKQIPVVVMSNSNDPDTFKRAMKLGASAYFYKMLSIDTLVYFMQAFLA